ncbi:ABC transporter permease [Adlercreutzia sp. ZJ154]|uniref:ABC transporter permease n=1 Tax=Adlercreutzia sp. ZJ154 TaxID=2709790 RepID=UPI0013EB857E|nr:ABC transporter permease [Adlercreutzia sp. ZJ154]
MNAMGRFTLKSLRANKVRTAVTVAGVALAAALLIAVLTSLTTLNDYLYHAEEATSGNWMAMSKLDDTDNPTQQLNEAKEAGKIDDYAVLQDVGFGQLSNKQRNVFGYYFPIVNISENADTLCGIHVTEGRMPENENEIIVIDTWKKREGIKIGDTLEMPAGQRMAVLTDNASTSTAEQPGKSDANSNSANIKEGDILDSSIEYLDASKDGGTFNETLTNIQERKFSVVGFCDYIPYSLYSISYDIGIAAFTANDPNANGAAFGYITMSGMSNTEQIEQRAEEVFSNSQDITLHSSMLRYMWIRGDGAIWNTFFGIVAVLASVIIVACVSLIYNAFAISVAERMGQFGLLSSIGASRKQLRRSVMLEALLVAIVGIPLGLLIGIGGCAVTFAALEPYLIVAIGGKVPYVISVSPWAVVLAACLTFATVILSVFIPTWRVGRVSAIDALHSTNERRVSKRGRKKSAKRTDLGSLWKKRRITSRIFGIGGTLAHINNKRGTSKGKTAAISLALAIVLLMTAGSLNTFIGYLVKAADETVKYDVGIGAQLEPDASLDINSQIQIYEDAYNSMCQDANAQPQGWLLSNLMPIVFPENLAGDSFRNTNDSSAPTPTNGGKLADDSYGALVYLMYIDDNTFNAFAEKIGASPAEFYNPDHPKAIATKSIYDNNGTTYQLNEIFKQSGNVQVITGGDYKGTPVSGFGCEYSTNTETGEAAFTFVPSIKGENDTTTTVPMEDVQVQTESLDIAYLADEMPDIVGMTGTPRLIVPMSLAQTHSFGTTSPSFSAAFNAKDNKHEELAESLTNIAKNQLNSASGEKLAWFTVNDYLIQQDNAHMMATIVNVFCLLFTSILTLIAVANVFNTVTNSLILRRREFAVMRSIGLSDKQFRTMIMNECVSFGIKGLIPGMLLSAVVSYLLFSMVTQSMSGLAFNFPWTYAAIAIAITTLAMGVSAAFGMHRCKANNVVEALRMDNI